MEHSETRGGKKGVMDEFKGEQWGKVHASTLLNCKNKSNSNLPLKLFFMRHSAEYISFTSRNSPQSANLPGNIFYFGLKSLSEELEICPSDITDYYPITQKQRGKFSVNFTISTPKYVAL